jgi:hypothetical protein
LMVCAWGMEGLQNVLQGRTTARYNLHPGHCCLGARVKPERERPCRACAQWASLS